MKIKHVLTACNENAFYSEFIPNFCRVWEGLFQGAVQVHVVLVWKATVPLPDYLLPYRDRLILFEPIESLSTALQAQCLRLFVPAILPFLESDKKPAAAAAAAAAAVEEGEGGARVAGGHEADAVLISDVDMVPANRDYYEKSVAAVPADKWVNYRHSVLLAAREFAMCYHAAPPQLWAQVFGVTEALSRSTTISSERVSRIWSQIRQLMLQAFGGVRYTGVPGDAGWNSDQRFLFDKLSAFVAQQPGVYVGLEDPQCGYLRLDRLEWESKAAHIARFRQLPRDLRDAILAGRYSDFHMLRPQSQYATVNGLMIDCVLQQQQVE
jgi:hypothetical protein